MDENGQPAPQEHASSELADRVARLEQEVARLQYRLDGRPIAPPPLPVTANPSGAQPAADPPSVTRAGVATTGTPPNAPLRTPVSIVPGSASPPRRSLENRLGSQIFNRIGIALLLIGTSWFLKLAVDRRWIVPSPAGRVLAGLIAGAGLVLWSERFRRKGYAAFSYSLKALGSGVLYLSLWAAFRVYGLLPAGVALALMVAVTVWNAYMAWAQDAELLAAYALAGGFVTPVLLSTGGNHETFLFTYLLAIDGAVVVLVRLKSWPRLLLGAFPLTVAFFLGWYIEHFRAEALALTALYIVLFDTTFSVVPIARRVVPAHSVLSTRRGTLIEDILLPVANAAFVALAFYAVLDHSGHVAWLPWVIVFYAAVYLGFMRLPQSRTARAIHLSIAIVLLTVAIPLKASGHWITVGWLVEGFALVWVALRLRDETDGAEEDAYAARVLRRLSIGALGLGLAGVLLHEFDSVTAESLALWSGDTGTALAGIAACAGAAWLLHTRGKIGWFAVLVGCVGAVDAIALVLALREVGASWSLSARHPPLQTSAFAAALIALAVLAGVIAASRKAGAAGSAVAGSDELTFWTSCTVATIIAFNVLAVLTGVREVASIWESRAGIVDVDAVLKQALAISGFLMAYGAALLALGFLRRNAFLRWQGLVLLLFTICKTFLYDMRNLSQGYRVVSFLALGALLMGVSFAYQKDWLALKPPGNPAQVAE